MNSPGWLGPSALRIGLGCMRLSTDATRGNAAAHETIAAAVQAGITIFDTAHAYGADDAGAAGDNERMVARAVRSCGAAGRATIITKGGMTRAGDGWFPDGRASAILAGCEASLAALDGLPIDLFLIHAPDPRRPWTTSVRALRRLLDEGSVAHVGLSNVNRRQLEEAANLVEVTAVEVALSVFDDSAERGGLLDLCEERGITVIAHSPLGGPRRARSIARRDELRDIAHARGATPEEVALAWVLDLSQAVVAIPGARRPETARSAARAASLTLDPNDQALVRMSFGWLQPRRAGVASKPVDDGEVVVIMGIPGAGKSRHAEEYVARGYVRLNRDERGGSLRLINDALDEALTSGTRRIVLDNTYLTRGARNHVLEAAAHHRLRARCIWIDTPLAQAQVNIVGRLLDRYGTLPPPDELRLLGRREPGILTPTRQMSTFRQLEPPCTDEGFSAVERIPFTREPAASPARSDTAGGVFVSAAALAHPGWQRAIALGDPSSMHLLFEWRPDATLDVLDDEAARLSAEVAGGVVRALCPHPGGPPVCWCRPPLPGLILAFARNQGVDVSRSALVGVGPAHRTLARTLGARYLPV
ncbi:MAG: aldo/keto reductase [Candidatus Dormibacteria bacterium]